MKQQRTSISKRLLCIALSAMLLLGILPLSTFAAPAGAAENCAVVAHGGSIAFENSSDIFKGTAPAGTVLTVTLDEGRFPGKTFDYWKSADGTEIPKKSFRLLVNRNAAFYPVFRDVTGNFGEWELLYKGKRCDDAAIFVRSDDLLGLKEYRIDRGGYHDNCRYVRVDDESHRKTCQDCGHTDLTGHWWDAGVITTEATHLTDGVKTYACIYCGAKKYEKVEKGGYHSYPSNPKASDYIIDEPAVNGKPGKRHLKCTECGYEPEPSEYIVSELPGSAGKVQHFTYERVSPYNASSSLSSARVEEHYIDDNAYYYSVKKSNCSYRFDFLWFDHGKHSPVYIRSGTRYGTPDSNYYGIVAYADSREEFIRMINSSHMLANYDNGRHSSMLTSEYSGSRYYEMLWNKDAYSRSKLNKIKENQMRDGWKTPLTVYEYNNGGTRLPLLYVDENNVCVYQYVGPGDAMELKFTEELDEFPFTEPDRDKITWYSYTVSDGTYRAESWDNLYFGMISQESADEDRTVKPNNAAAGKYFSHWEKYDFNTKKYEACSDKEIWTPSVSDVTRLRAVFKDVYYHIKVNGGYYKVSTGWEKWSDESYTEGDVIYGKDIRLYSDSSMIPEGMQEAGFVDKDHNKLDSYTFRPDADGEYTMTYETKEAYFEASAKNGVVKKDGEVFNGGRLPIGSQITLTTESSDSSAYPYFIGWCRVQYSVSGEEYTVVSSENTYTATVTDSYSDNRIVAVWSASPTLPEKTYHNITAVNGFVKGEGDVFVSAVRVVSGSYIQVVRDPSHPLRVQQWVAADAETGTEIEIKTAYDYGTHFEISAQGGGKYDGKGGKPGEGGVSYPQNVIITGMTDVCTEHAWDDGVITTEPNYEEDGVKTLTCVVCGTQKTEPVAKLERYCVHACKTCGKCTLPAEDVSCKDERCSCTSPNPPILINQSGAVSGTPNGIVLTVVEVEGDSEQSTPYLNYCLEAAEGYEIERIYDISLMNPDGSEYSLADGETATVTLDVGKENARALQDGRLYVIHIAVTGKETYGVGHKPITVDTENGTVTFEVDSFSPFLLVRSPIEYYGREALLSLANKEALLFAYDQIVRGVESSAESISVFNGVNPITKEELETVFDAYRRDHTEHFWLGNGYTISYDSTTAVAHSIAPTYTLSGAALESAKTAFNVAVAEMLSGITSTMSEYEREKLLHDRLAEKATYDDTAANAHNAYGALVENRAVCDGYANALQYLLQKAGIQSFILSGFGQNPATGVAERHKWNVVRIDGKYYHVDATWNDQGEHIFYAYFNKKDEVIAEDHTVDAAAYALPVCNSENADYFFINGGKLPAFDVAAVAELLKNGGGTARVYVTGDKAAFAAEIGKNENVLALATALGYVGRVQYSYANLGREFIITLKPIGVTVSGAVTSFGSASDLVTIQLIKQGESTPAFTTTVSGGTKTGNQYTAGYSFAEVPAGNYTVRVSKSKHCPREYTLSIGTENETLDLDVWLYGDVNRNGTADGSDASQILRMYAGMKSIFDQGDDATRAYRRMVANVNGITNGNPTVDGSDATQILRNYAGLPSVFRTIP